MAVRADAANGVVTIDTIFDLVTAQAVRDAVLQMDREVAIDFRDVRDVHDSALAYLVTALRLSERPFTIRGLSWPHADLLQYLGVEPSHHRA